VARRFLAVKKRGRKLPAPPPRATRRAFETQASSFALYRIAAQLPKDSWGYHFSRAHPGVRLELLNRIDVGQGLLLAEVRMTGEGAELWPEESKREPGIVAVEAHPEGPQRVLYRVTFSAPSIHVITQQHHVLTRYPIVIQDGMSRFETFAAASQMRDYLDELRTEVGPNRIEAVRRSEVSAGGLGLTPAQDSVFRGALNAGYFKVPRGISVTELAARLGRSKSTVSVALVKIQRALADSALQMDLDSFRSSP